MVIIIIITLSLAFQVKFTAFIIVSIILLLFNTT